MATVTTPSPEDHARNIATLSRQLDLPEVDVRAVYRKTLDELIADARISNYISILAMSNTRSILRRRTGAETMH